MTRVPPRRSIDFDNSRFFISWLQHRITLGPMHDLELGILILLYTILPGPTLLASPLLFPRVPTKSFNYDMQPARKLRTYTCTLTLVRAWPDQITWLAVSLF
jgi:hypothetical protein